jgi:hypothetical protein
MRSLVLISLSLALASPAIADKLPKKAVPLTAAEVTARYADHTAVWQRDNAAFFAADGSVKGYYKQYRLDGKWTVAANKACMVNQTTDSKTQTSDGKTYTDCWEFFAHKGKVYSIYSNDRDAKNPDRSDGWYSSEFDKLKSGNKAEALYKKMGGI